MTKTHPCKKMWLPFHDIQCSKRSAVDPMHRCVKPAGHSDPHYHKNAPNGYIVVYVQLHQCECGRTCL